ncbi:MAG: 1-acyl-sn-glycerol-3-phosphate acyltransferase [Chloroflexota bacterium]
MTTDERRVGPRPLSVEVTPRYRVMWRVNRLLVRLLFDVRAEGLERWPAAPFQVVLNHHNGWDPQLVMAVAPMEPRITWFGPREADFSHGFKNRVMSYFGGMIPYHPEKSTLTSAVRAVRRVFASGGVLGIFAEGRVGWRESALLPFEEGAAAFAAIGGVPVVPAAIVGSSLLWWRRRVVVRFGDPIPVRDARGAAAREELEAEIRDAILALLPTVEPRLPRRRPLRFLGDLLNGADDTAARRAELGE